MALILSLETATSVCSVAIHEKGILKGSNTFYLEKSHSSLLVPMIDSLIERCGYEKKGLDAIAVSEGPGSYTGLRIGVSTAKGYCYALEIPLIAVNTLYGLSSQVAKFINKGKMLCPMIDARRMEVYTCLFDHHLEVVKSTHPLVVEEDSFEDQLDKGEILFFGNGADKCKSIIKHPNAIFIDDLEPSADHIGYLAYQKFIKSAFEDVAYFEPFYLKEFRATTPRARI